MKQLMVTAMRPDLMEDHSQLFPMPAPRKVASLFFEEQPKHTLKTMAGMVIRKRVHVPGTVYDKVALREAMESFRGLRSEEHTSELQSLMRISYAVFCLKKTKNTNITRVL